MRATNIRGSGPLVAMYVLRQSSAFTACPTVMNFFKPVGLKVPFRVRIVPLKPTECWLKGMEIRWIALCRI